MLGQEVMRASIRVPGWDGEEWRSYRRGMLGAELPALIKCQKRECGREKRKRMALFCLMGELLREFRARLSFPFECVGSKVIMRYP